MRKTILMLTAILVLSFLSSPVKTHENNFELHPLAGEYSIVTETEYLGNNSWIFRYIITNLTEEGDWTTPPLSGLPAWMQGIDFTGLSNFFVKVPHGAVISNVQLPQSYGASHGSFNPADIHEWQMQGPWHEPGDDIYDWIMIFPYGIFEIYPKGEALTFSFQIDGRCSWERTRDGSALTFLTIGYGTKGTRTNIINYMIPILFK